MTNIIFQLNSNISILFNSFCIFRSSVLRSSDVFQSSLVLVECSKSLISHGSCQIPTKRNDPRIWYWHDLSHYIYQKSSFEVKLNCSLWGQVIITIVSNKNNFSEVLKSKPCPLNKKNACFSGHFGRHVLISYHCYFYLGRNISSVFDLGSQPCGRN